MALKAFLDQNEGWEEALQYKNLSDDSDWIGDLSELIDKYGISIKTAGSPMGELIAGLKDKGISKFSTNIVAIAKEVCYNLDYERTDSHLDSLIVDVESNYPFLMTMFKRTYMGNFDEESMVNLFEMVDALDRINLGGC